MMTINLLCFDRQLTSFFNFILHLSLVEIQSKVHNFSDKSLISSYWINTALTYHNNKTIDNFVGRLEMSITICILLNFSIYLLILQSLPDPRLDIELQIWG